MGLLQLILRSFFGSPNRRKRHHHTTQPVRRPQSASRPDLVASAKTLPRTDAALVGHCWVIDGDTIDIGGTRIRLAGIDAPEMDHPYGRNAKWALVALCKGAQIRAVFSSELSHDRTVATCYLPDGRDISAEMVKLGMAIDWPKFSGGKYRHLEPDGVRKKLWRCDARQKGRMPPSLPD